MIENMSLLGNRLPLLTSFSTAKSDLLPLVFLAIALDIGIVGLWYLIGELLHNTGVKKSAIGELYQTFGTAIIAFVVIFAVLTFSSIFYQSLNSTSLMSQNTISGICANLEGNSQLTLSAAGAVQH